MTHDNQEETIMCWAKPKCNGCEYCKPGMETPDGAEPAARTGTVGFWEGLIKGTKG